MTSYSNRLMFNTSTIERLIVELSTNSFDPKKNFYCALEYERLGQVSSAACFYLRAAEHGYETDPLIVYASLIKTSHCFAIQGQRKNTVENLLRQAMCYLPKRPEAYFFLSQIRERDKDYHNSYMWASIGLEFTEEAEKNPLPVDVGYLPYGLIFEKGVCAYWIGRKDESKEIFKALLDTPDLDPEYLTACQYNMDVVGKD